MKLSFRVVVHFVTIAAACSAGEAAAPPAPVDHDVEGSWKENTRGALDPGNIFQLSLFESGGTVVGSGAYAGEAGPQGSLAASGTVTHDTLRLRIIFTPDPVLLPGANSDTAQFVGELTSHDQIDGTLTVGTVNNAFGLVRLPPIIDPH